MTIHGKTVLVTGASRGIGQALVEEPCGVARRRCMPLLVTRSLTLMSGSRR